MNKNETEAVESLELVNDKTAQPASKKASQKKNSASREIVVYLGPTIAGVVVQNTVFNNGITAALKTAIEEEPSIGNLLVPISKLPYALKEINNKNGAMYVLNETAKRYKPMRGE